MYLLAAGAARSNPGWTIGGTGHRYPGHEVSNPTLAVLPIVLPVLPAADIGWTYGINQVPAESVGWPQLVDMVRTQWDALPPAERARLVIFTADYGEVGAINELGRDEGLPTAVRGQNSEWWWRPGNPRATTELAMAPGPRDVTGYGRYLATFF